MDAWRHPQKLQIHPAIDVEEAADGMSGRSYNLRASPGRARVTTTAASSTTTSYAATTSASSSSYSDERTLTPAPVQRTLYMEEADDEEEDDEDDEEVVEQLNGYNEDAEEEEEVDAFGRGARLARGHDEDEDDDAELTEDDDQDETAHDTLGRFNRPRKTPGVGRDGALGSWGRRAANSAFFKKLSRSRHVRQATSAVREIWQFVVRNSFMTFNFMWLLVPLGCFLIAILVPHYLTTAIRYVDILTTSSNGFQANLAYEKGMMRSIVQEIVDVKLSTMQEEITSLRNTIVAQEREFEALRLLHESLRQVHEDTQKKLSVVDSNSILSIHIEHVVSKHAETLWKRLQDKTTKIEDTVRATANKQHELIETVSQHQDDILELRTTGVASSAAKPPSMTKANERALKEELQTWKATLQEELHMSLEREVVDIEDRMHKSLLTEKQILEDSVKTLNTLDATNPALVSMIESAVVKVEKKNSGAPDYAALANGASVVRHESDLLDSKSISPVQLLGTMLGYSGDAYRFTSSSLRSSLLLKLSSLFVPEDIPWWLSRHNARPETALSETREIGSCWGLAGPTGRLTVKFAQRIFADAVTIDHIPEEIATDFSTAPQNFRVFGVAADRSREVVEFLPFGNFTYSRDGAASQTFRLTTSLSQRIAIDAATLEIVSNHGHPDYTCLYRFQVHGSPSP